MIDRCRKLSSPCRRWIFVMSSWRLWRARHCFRVLPSQTSLSFFLFHLSIVIDSSSLGKLSLSVTSHSSSCRPNTRHHVLDCPSSPPATPRPPKSTPAHLDSCQQNTSITLPTFLNLNRKDVFQQHRHRQQARRPLHCQEP